MLISTALLVHENHCFKAGFHYANIYSSIGARKCFKAGFHYANIAETFDREIHEL